MNRNISTDALILKAERFGEMNKTVTLFSPDLGVVRAAAYGVYKGKNKLSGATEPFKRGTAYLYYEPVKKRYKVTAIDLTDTYDAIPLDLDRYFTASLWAEIMIKGYGGGDEAWQLYGLLCASFAALMTFDPTLVNVQFLFRYLQIEGYGVDLQHCSHCDSRLAQETVSYIAHDGGIICERCASDGAPELPPGVRRYLRHTSSQTLEDAVKVGMGADLLRITKAFLVRRVQSVMEFPLKSLEAGAG